MACVRPEYESMACVRPEYESMACVRPEYESKIISSSPQPWFLKLTMLFMFEKKRLIYAANLSLFVACI